MTTTFLKGVKKPFIYYTTGFGLAYLSYFIFGHQYSHGPGLHHLIAFFVLFGGLLWGAYNFVRIIGNRKDRTNLASLLINLFVVISVLIYLIILDNSKSGEDASPNKEDIITIYRDSSTKSSTVVNGLGDTLLFKVGDSVIIDKSKGR